MSAPPELPDDRDPRLRRLAPGRLRLLLPQRDRPAARRPGRHARRHDGGVRHRLRRGHGLAAVRRTRRGHPHPHRRARRRRWPRPPRRSSRDDDQVEVLAADWSTLLDRGPFSLLFLDSGKPSASRPGQGRRADGRRRHRGARRLHAVPARGRRSSTAGSTPCARSGSATSGSPRSRCSWPPTPRP